MCAFQIIGKTPLPSVSGLSACEIREYSAPRQGARSLRVPPLFTSSSRWNERIHPSLPMSSMRERTFPLDRDLYTMIFQEIEDLPFEEYPGGCSTVVQISRFVFFFLRPLFLSSSCFRRENSRIVANENVISEWWFKRIFDGF